MSRYRQAAGNSIFLELGDVDPYRITGTVQNIGVGIERTAQIQCVQIAELDTDIGRNIAPIQAVGRQVVGGAEREIIDQAHLLK